MSFRKQAIPISLGGINFPTKTLAIERTRAILHGAPVGEALQATDFAIIRDLLNCHPDSAQKIGCGVASIEVRINAEFSQQSRGFWLVRHDGTCTDFSYKTCMAPRPDRDNFLASCRFAIREHIEFFREEFFATAITPTCPLTGEPITADTSDVDHIPPYTFARIVEGFTGIYGLSPDDRTLCEHGNDQVMIPTFSSKLLHDRWIHFHNSFAKLRVISKAANGTIVPKFARQR